MFKPLSLSLRKKQNIRVKFGNVTLLETIVSSLAIKLWQKKAHELIDIKMCSVSPIELLQEMMDHFQFDICFRCRAHLVQQLAYYLK